MKKILTILVLSSSILLSCKKEEKPVESDLAAETKADVSYGADVKQKMDIYLPAKRTTANTKVLFLIHGGSWIFGDRKDLSTTIPAIQAKLPGWAIVNVSYRLGYFDVNSFPTQENDIKAASEFIYNHREEYNISTKWAYLGLSAGGHLAMLQSYKHALPVKPLAVINYFGPSDMVALYNFASSDFFSNATLSYLLKGNPTTNPTLYANSSPINYITAQTPPTITLYGSADNTVPPAQHTALHAKLKASGVPEKLIEYPGQQHSFDPATYNISYTEVVNFLNTYVK